MKFADCFSGEKHGEGEWQFELDESINGAFGGTTGGVLAALAVYVARDMTPGRQVAGIDARFIRGFRPGTAIVTGTLINAGRTLSTVQVSICSSEGKLCTLALVSLVNRDSLANVAQPDVPAPSGLLELVDAKRWPQPKPPMQIPLIDLFEPAFMGKTSSGLACAVKTIWDKSENCAEAICIAADLSVGPPVMGALKGQCLATPNPDISLRFCRDIELPDFLIACCRLESLAGGLAITRIEARTADTLLAAGVATTTCIRND